MQNGGEISREIPDQVIPIEMNDFWMWKFPKIMHLNNVKQSYMSNVNFLPFAAMLFEGLGDACAV